MARAASPLSGRKVVVLPDLYVDAIVSLPPWAKAKPGLERVLGNGGGNLPVGPIAFKVGGNAANTGMALARLGADVELVARTGSLGLAMLGEAARATGLGTSLVTLVPEGSATLALEFGPSNLMLSHAGPVARFGPSALSDAAWEAIDAADAVCVTNWSQNRQGSALLRAVSRRAARNRAHVFVDTSDPRHRPGAASELVNPALWRDVTAWGMNENELRAVTGAARASMATAMALSRRVGCRIDLHTRRWAASAGAGFAVRVPGVEAKPRRLTGAGDAWNAGNVAGDLLGLSAEGRLRLAHAVAHRYITGPSDLPPTAAEVPPALWRP